MSLPEAYQKEIQELNEQLLASNPSDILQFCADYFSKRLASERLAFLSSKETVISSEPPPTSASTMSTHGFTNPFGSNPSRSGSSRINPGVMHNVIEEEENDAVGSPTSPSFGTKSAPPVRSNFSGPFGASSSSHGPQSGIRNPPNLDGYPPRWDTGRRASVSAEPLRLEQLSNWRPPVIPKTPEQLGWMKKAMQANFLLNDLDDEQSAQFLGALAEEQVGPHTTIITQGEYPGEFFYLVEKGYFDVFVNGLSPDKKVTTIGPGGLFGELALLHNHPRAATVKSAGTPEEKLAVGEPETTEWTLWKMDRLTFRSILGSTSHARQIMYERFLLGVPLLNTLSPEERSKIAQVLKPKTFEPGEIIIRQGDKGDEFFLLVEGEAEALKDGNLVKRYSQGDFFGELALLDLKEGSKDGVEAETGKRQATVKAVARVKVATLPREAFVNLLGPLTLQFPTYDDVKSGVEDVDPRHVPA